MLALLEETKITDVTAAHLDGLLGREENQRLEFKETIDGVAAYELAKDLASIANADGGYFVVGAVQDRKTERCTGFKTVQNPDPTFKKIKDIAAEHLQDRLILEPVLRTTTTGESLVLVSIPDAPRLHAVINKGRAEHWVRVGRDKRPMRPHEIEAAILASGQRRPNIAIECHGFLLSTNLPNPNSATLVVEIYVTNTGAPTALHQWELRYHFRDHFPYGVASQPLRMHADFAEYKNIARMETPIDQLRTGALIANIYHENIGRGETLAELFIFCTEVLTGKVHRVDFSKGSPSLAHPHYQ
jgi:hypothetical protein